MLRDHRKRIVLIDDHILLRQGLERLLNSDEFVVIEEAGNAEEGIEIVRETRPDAVIVDVGLPGARSGIELTEQITREFPNVIVIILSAHEQSEYGDQARAAGAVRYICKDEAVEKLRDSLREAFSARA